MKNKKFILASLVTAVVLFILNAIVFVVFLKDFFFSHPAVSKEFMKQLYLPEDRLVWWAVVLSVGARDLPRASLWR